MDIKSTLSTISQKFGYKLQETSPNVFRIDVAILMADQSIRYQNVWVWTIANRHYGKPVIYLNSRCGEFNLTINFNKFMKEMGAFSLSQATIAPDKRADGSDCESIVTQGVLPIHLANQALLEEMLFDVANQADFIEMHYFGGADIQ